MPKKITDNQQSGIEKEYVFAAFATRIGLIPTSCKNDFGFDFICQIKGKQLSSKLSLMEGKFVAVSVRSTINKKKPTIKINKSDAELFVSCNFPFILALVSDHPQKGSSVHLKFSDSQFMKDLSSFINSKHKEKSISTKDCISDKDEITKKISLITNAEHIDKMKHLIRSLNISNIFPESKLDIIRKIDGSFSIIRLSRFEDQFDISTEKAEDLLIKTAFGVKEQIENRLGSLKLKEGFIKVAKELPSPIILTGPGFDNNEQVKLTATNKSSKASCLFEYRRIKTHFGFYHNSGLSLIISESRKYKRKHVHFCKCNLDIKADTNLSHHPDLCNFLEIFIEDSIIKVEKSGLEIASSYFSHLRPYGYLVHYLSQIKNVSGLDLLNWRLEDSSEEDLQSLRVISELYSNKNSIKNWGFVMGETEIEKLTHNKRRFLIPLCMNLKKEGVIVWLNVNGTIFEKNQDIVGLKVDNVLDYSIEKSDKPFLTSGFPSFKICAEWPAISIYQNLKIKMKFKYEDWKVGIKFLNL